MCLSRGAAANFCDLERRRLAVEAHEGFRVCVLHRRRVRNHVQELVGNQDMPKIPRCLPKGTTRCAPNSERSFTSTYDSILCTVPTIDEHVSFHEYLL